MTNAGGGRGGKNGTPNGIGVGIGIGTGIGRVGCMAWVQALGGPST